MSSGSVNKVILLGNLGSDPELRHAPSGPVLSMSLATTERWTKDGEKHEETTWHRLTVWGQRAEGLSGILTKGDKIYVEGRIRKSKYTDKKNIEREAVDIVVSNIEFADVKGKNSEGNESAPKRASKPAGSKRPARPQAGQGDDDVPY